MTHPPKPSTPSVASHEAPSSAAASRPSTARPVAPAQCAAVASKATVAGVAAAPMPSRRDVASPEPGAAPPVAAAAAAQADVTTVGEIMSPSAVCLSPEARIDAVTRMFLERGIGSAPVVDEAWRPLGIVSKSDLLRALSEEHAADPAAAEPAAAPAGYAGAPDPGGRVGEITSPNVLTLHPEAPVAVAAALMAYEGVHRLPIVATTGEVVGIVSTLDIVKWVARCTDLDAQATAAPKACP